MPAELVSGFFGSTDTGERWAAWHRLGNVIDRPVVNTAEAIELAGLDWDVETHPLTLTLPDGRTTTSEREVVQVRADTGQILGVTSPGYVSIQNRERFAFMDDLLASDDAKWHTAGVLRGGRQVWMLARLPIDVTLAGIDTEQIHWYLLLSDGTSGDAALKIAPTPVRVVCTNTCRWALQTAPRIWTARHTRSIEGRMQEARTTLRLTYAYVEEFQSVANDLIGTRLSPGDFRDFLAALVPLPESGTVTDRTWRNAAEKRDAIRHIYQTADNLADVRGTRWAALQAVGEYNDWHTGRGPGAEPSAAKIRASEEAAWLRRLGSPAESLKDSAMRLLTR